MSTYSKACVPALPNGGLSRAKDILPLLPFKRASLWRMSRAGTFPQPIKVSESITAWSNDEVMSWLDNQTVASNEETK